MPTHGQNTKGRYRWAELDPTQGHCGTLDRLHLAAMELLGVSRLLTHDARQAQAARGLGFEVLGLNRSVP